MAIGRRAMLSVLSVGVVGIASASCARFRRHARAPVARTLPAVLIDAIHGHPDKAEERILERAIATLERHDVVPLEALAKKGRPLAAWPDTTRRSLEKVIARYATASAKFRHAIGAPTELPEHVTACGGLARAG